MAVHGCLSRFMAVHDGTWRYMGRICAAGRRGGGSHGLFFCSFESAALLAPSVATASSHGMHKILNSSSATLARASSDAIRFGIRLAATCASLHSLQLKYILGYTTFMRVRTRTYWYILVHTIICLFFRLENTCSVQVILRRSPAVSSAFPMGSADTADAHGRRGSNVHEVNAWLWMFARGKPRLGWSLL